MSANRSVQAAQRRRSGPVETVPTRGPQPSINSSQMFANQSRAPQRPSRQQSENNIGNIGKMTLPQAITLITLRLGSLESKILNMNEMSMSGQTMTQVMNEEGMALINQGVIDSISSRLESLEKRSTTTSSPEVNLLKQQIETLKQNIIQNKSISVKETKDLKLEIENLKQELFQTKELLSSIQNITMENNGKIMELSMNFYTEDNFEEIDNDDKLDELQEAQYVNNEIVGIDLKQVIEGEINTSINDE
jgi:hypothetical protein